MDGRRLGGSGLGRAGGAVLRALLFDTTYLVDAERSGDSLDDAIHDDDDIAIAAITVAELRMGVLLATDRTRAARTAFLEDVLDVIPVLEYNRDVAETHAELLVHVRSHGRPRGAHDLVIAASARTAGRTVVTADASAFSDLPGVPVLPHRPRRRG